MNTIAELVKQYTEALKQQHEAEDKALEFKNRARALEENLYAAMVGEEMPMCAVEGIGVVRTTVKLRASCRKGMKEDLFAALREHGYGDIIKEEVNARTLEALVKEIAEQNDGNIPDWVDETCNTFRQNAVSIRAK